MRRVLPSDRDARRSSTGIEVKAVRQGDTALRLSFAFPDSDWAAVGLNHRPCVMLGLLCHMPAAAAVAESQPRQAAMAR